MPICQECQAPYEEWQHFCLQCGKYLKEGPRPCFAVPNAAQDWKLCLAVTKNLPLRFKRLALH